MTDRISDDALRDLLAWFNPDFAAECRICGTSPCVIVKGHKQPDTELCGLHFFTDPAMRDWQLWNEQEDE